MATEGKIDRIFKLTNCKKTFRNKVISTKSFLFSCYKLRKMLAQKRSIVDTIFVDNIIILYNRQPDSHHIIATWFQGSIPAEPEIRTNDIIVYHTRAA